MTRNLLQPIHDKITHNFLIGVIPLDEFMKYEVQYDIYKELFIINMN